jgi:5-formyltetrahydrofolate cyclo-ligase
MRGEVATRKAQMGPRTSEQADRLGAQAALLLMNSPEFGAAASVAMYAALPDELATRPLFEAARDAGRECVFPRIGATDELEFAAIGAWEDLRCGRYGVPEPVEGSGIVPLPEVDLVLVPGLAFDRSGCRLGRGGGYYDRALCALREAGSTRASVFGLAYDWQLIDDVPRDEGDELVDAIATDRRIVRIGSRGGPATVRGRPGERERGGGAGE